MDCLNLSGTPQFKKKRLNDKYNFSLYMKMGNKDKTSFPAKKPLNR